MTNEEKIIESIRRLGRGKEKTFVAIVEENYPNKDIYCTRSSFVQIVRH